MWTKKTFKHNTYLFNLVGDKGKKLEYTFIKVIKEKWGQYFANNHFYTPLCSKKNGSLGIKLFSKAKSTKPSE